MKSQTFHSRSLPVILGVVVLIVAHVAVFGVGLRWHASLAAVAGVIGVVAMKYVWWRFRR